MPIWRMPQAPITTQKSTRGIHVMMVIDYNQTEFKLRIALQPRCATTLARQHARRDFATPCRARIAACHWQKHCRAAQSAAPARTMRVCSHEHTNFYIFARIATIDCAQHHQAVAMDSRRRAIPRFTQRLLAADSRGRGGDFSNRETHTVRCMVDVAR